MTPFALRLGAASLLILAAPVRAQPHAAHAQPHAAPTETAVPTLRSGVQTIAVAVTPAGYSPARIALRAGVPARIVFTRTVDGGCVQSGGSPELDFARTALPLGRPVAVEFTPTAAGTFSFACASGMVRGAVIVRS